MTNGRVNPQFTLEDQGITGLGTVYYNLLEPTLIDQALERKEGTLGKGGAFWCPPANSLADLQKTNMWSKLRLWPIAFGGKTMRPCLRRVLRRSTRI